MKRLFALFLVMTLLVGCAAPKSIEEEPQPIMTEVPEPIEEEPRTPAEEPEMAAPPEQAEEPAAVPTPEEIEAKTRQSSICLCMATEHAQWNLARHGFGDYTGEPLNSVMSAFSAYIADNAEQLTQTCGDLLNRTLWIIDHDEAGYYLQIIRFGDTAEQLMVLKWDGADISIYEESKTLSGYVPGNCAKHDSSEAYHAAITQYKQLDYSTTPVFFYRICLIEDETYTRVAFMETVSSPETIGVYSSSHWRNSTGREMPLRVIPSDLTPISPELERILRMDFSEIIYKNEGSIGDDVVLLQDFLLRFLMDSPSRNLWDIPAAASPIYSEFYHIKNTLLTFMDEITNNVQLKEQFPKINEWKITLLGGAYYAVAGVIDNDNLLVMASAMGGLSGTNWVSLNRERIQQMADEGYHSDLIPSEIRKAFVDYVMTDYSYCYYLSGCDGRSIWRWSIQEDGIYTMKCDWFRDGNIGTEPNHWILLQLENETVQQTDQSKLIYK